MQTHTPSKAFNLLDDAITDTIYDALENDCSIGVVTALLAIKSVMGNILVDRVPGSFELVESDTNDKPKRAAATLTALMTQATGGK
jgi:hypothetical protein